VRRARTPRHEDRTESGAAFGVSERICRGRPSGRPRLKVNSHGPAHPLVSTTPAAPAT
jgi:hypothetical protein